MNAEVCFLIISKHHDCLFNAFVYLLFLMQKLHL